VGKIEMGYTKEQQEIAKQNKLMTQIGLTVIGELLLLTGESPEKLVKCLKAICPKGIKVPSSSAIYREFSEIIAQQKENERILGIDGHELRVRFIQIPVNYDDKHKGEPLQFLCFYDALSNYLSVEWLTASKSISQEFINLCVENIQNKIKIPLSDLYITHTLLETLPEEWLVETPQTLSAIQHNEEIKALDYLIDNSDQRQRVKSNINETVEKYEKYSVKQLNQSRAKFKPTDTQPDYLTKIKQSQSTFQIPTDVMRWFMEDALHEQLFTDTMLGYLKQLPIETECEKISWADVNKITSDLQTKFGTKVAIDFEEHITAHNLVYTHCKEIPSVEARLLYKRWLITDQFVFK
jgi:hypothetical protein